jgi:DNA-binding transcriptional regulator YiaG
MTEEERHRAALSDPDCPPATKAQLARARRVPTVGELRKKLNLTQEEFAALFISRSEQCEIGNRARIVRTRLRKCC